MRGGSFWHLQDRVRDFRRNVENADEEVIRVGARLVVLLAFVFFVDSVAIVVVVVVAAAAGVLLNHQIAQSGSPTRIRADPFQHELGIGLPLVADVQRAFVHPDHPLLGRRSAHEVLAVGRRGQNLLQEDEFVLDCCDVAGVEIASVVMRSVSAAFGFDDGLSNDVPRRGVFGHFEDGVRRMFADVVDDQKGHPFPARFVPQRFVVRVDVGSGAAFAAAAVVVPVLADGAPLADDPVVHDQVSVEELRAEKELR